VVTDLRDRLEEELHPDRSGFPGLPVDELVAGALRRGRRLVRIRRATAALVTAGVVLVIALVGWTAWPGGVASVRPVPGTTPTTHDLRPATASSIALALERRLPAGARVTAVFRYEGDPPAAAVYVDHGSGPGLVQVTVDTYASTNRTCQPGLDRTVSCETELDGSLTAVTWVAGDCQQATIVEYFRPDGVHVSLYLAACLMWDGQREPPAAAPLTVAQARALVADPVWGRSMDAGLVTAGQARFPSPALWVSTP
jgi:hypothetical protein